MNSFEVQQVNTPSYLVILSSERPRLSELSNRPLSMVVKIAWGLARPLLRHVLSGGFHSYIPITPILPKANPFIDGKNESGPHPSYAQSRHINEGSKCVCVAKSQKSRIPAGSVSDLLVYAINYALAKYVNHRQIGNWRANGERNSEPAKVGDIIVARAVRPSFATKI